MKSMTQEDVEKVLTSNKHIKFHGWIKPNCTGFSRTASFSVRGADYEIEWYCNSQILRCGEMQTFYDYFRLDDTWPEHFKKFLQFYIGNEKIVAIIPVEEFGEDKEVDHE